jgi:plasmid replication initiation protein
MSSPFRHEVPSKVSDARQRMVVQANDFVRHARNQMSAQELDIIYFWISKIKPTDADFNDITFTVEELCEICGINESGKNYSDVKKAVKSIADKSCWVEMKNGAEWLVRWLDLAIIEPNSGTMTIRLGQSIKPFLLHLINIGNYSQAELINFLALRSKYGKRLYEILKSYENLIEYTFEIDALKKILCSEKYDMYKDFRVKVLDVAIKEINDFGDISVTYTIIKKGKKAHKIKFIIKPKKGIKERVETFKKIEQNINPRKRKMSDIPNIFVSYDDNEPIIDTIMNNTDI